MAAPKQQMSLLAVGAGYLGPALHKAEDISTLAKKILDMYDKDKTGTLGHTEIANILMDMYRSINKSINPTKYDIETFSRVLDINRDGKVTQPDIEDSIRKFLKAEVDYKTTMSSSNSTSTLTSSKVLR